MLWNTLKTQGISFIENEWGAVNGYWQDIPMVLQSGLQISRGTSNSVTLRELATEESYLDEVSE